MFALKYSRCAPTRVVFTRRATVMHTSARSASTLQKIILANSLRENIFKPWIKSPAYIYDKHGNATTSLLCKSQHQGHAYLCNITEIIAANCLSVSEYMISAHGWNAPNFQSHIAMFAPNRNHEHFSLLYTLDTPLRIPLEEYIFTHNIERVADSALACIDKFTKKWWISEQNSNITQIAISAKCDMHISTTFNFLTEWYRYSHFSLGDEFSVISFDIDESAGYMYITVMNEKLEALEQMLGYRLK